MTEPVLIGLSGGINSMAVLCWLAEQKEKPTEVHLFYAHFKEHSPDTFQFVADGIRFARTQFEKVFVQISKNSVLDFFREQHFIPHPKASPCSIKLKIIPIENYCAAHGIKIDLIGYVKHELKRRGGRQQNSINESLFSAVKKYPIGEFTDEWCFDIVEKYIGWYPFIYTIKDENGKRIFKHNNCFPCKNMDMEELKDVEKYLPEHHLAAVKLSADISRYWGRDGNEYYFTFVRPFIGQDSTCEYCKF